MQNASADAVRHYAPLKEFAMSLSISSSSPSYVAAKDALAKDGSASEASSTTSGSTAPDSGNKYLGSYIASATAALSLLTQTSSEQASAALASPGQAGSAAQKDSANLYQITSDLVH
jgi:hypothetical protein